MRNLSKSKIIAFRQCPKRLWLEIHKPELRDDSASEVVFAIGNQVGEVARDIYGPDHTGDLIDINLLGHGAALARSAELLAQGHKPIFETVMFAVPIWKGCRPYQQIPFQFSLHRINQPGDIQHSEFLDLSGADPSEAFTQNLIDQCGSTGPVFVYNAAFEMTRIRELAERFPTQAAALHAINDRIVDLLPIARNRYYHPSQHGSWSIKAVLPAICPDLSYDHLEGVQDGGMAVESYKEAIAPNTTPERKQEIRRQLIDYCKLDTFAMVRMWAIFGGRETRNIILGQ